ncbi:MAG TPA: hypothetical protein VFM40_04575 [Actinomycetota bacterium]|nr:hypothetical protein [Actinomycetota bacterium]
MSQTSTPQLPMPPPPMPEPAAPAPSRRGMIALAVAVVLVVVAGLVAFAITRGDSAEAQPLALSFTQGQQRTYDVHQTMDANISSPLFGDEPLSLDVTQVIGWKVVSVDDAGTATIEVTVSDMSGTVNGTEVPSAPAPPIEIRIAADGRVLFAGGLSLGGAGQTRGFGFPGMGQLTPILPDEGDAVSVGDTWDKEFSQDFPFGEGTIDFSASSTYVRNETVDGREAAVIETRMTVPIDATLELDELLGALGPEITGATGAAGLEQLADGSIAYLGRGTFAQTSFVDLDARELLKTQSRGRFDISMTFEIPGLAQGSGEMNFAGSFTQELELR